MKIKSVELEARIFQRHEKGPAKNKVRADLSYCESMKPTVSMLVGNKRQNYIVVGLPTMDEWLKLASDEEIVKEIERRFKIRPEVELKDVI